MPVARARMLVIAHAGSLASMGLTTIRYVLPAVLVVAGFVILFVADDSLRWDGWAMCVGAGLALLLLNVLFRYGAKGDRERDARGSRARVLRQARPLAGRVLSQRSSNAFTTRLGAVIRHASSISSASSSSSTRARSIATQPWWPT